MKSEKNHPTRVCLTLPAWLKKTVADHDPIFSSAKERMRWVIELSRQNVEHGSGGPFAATVFASDSGKGF